MLAYVCTYYVNIILNESECDGLKRRCRGVQNLKVISICKSGLRIHAHALIHTICEKARPIFDSAKSCKCGQTAKKILRTKQIAIKSRKNDFTEAIILFTSKKVFHKSYWFP